jgi:hypothetical protein
MTMVVPWRKGPPSNHRFGKWCATTFSPTSLQLPSDANFAFVMNSADSGFLARAGRVAALTASSYQGVGCVYKASQLQLTLTDSR